MARDTMPTGKLNRRIQVQQQGVNQDSYGQPIQTWYTVYTCWANIDVQRSQLIYSTAEFINKNTVRVWIRYTWSLVFSTGDRLVYTEPTTGVVHTYEIQSVLNPEQSNVWIQFLVYELEPNE